MNSVQAIVEIMEYVWLHDEEKSEEELKKKFGEKKYDIFHKYCIGGQEPYAQIYDNRTAKLSQKGIRKLPELRATLVKEKMDKLMVWATIAIASSAIIQVIYLFCQYFQLI